MAPKTMVHFDLQRQVEELQNELERTRKELKKLQEEAESDVDTLDIFAPPPDKKGYMFQWQDRSIGWGGTKWSLLFVSLERGRIACYQSHMDEAPVSVLTLRGCAVQDEGRKVDRKYKEKKSKKGGEDSKDAADEPRFFHVFGIFHRPESYSDSDQGLEKYESSTMLPLLRFSTTSLAEKNMWMDLISQTCAYCETEHFMADEAAREAEKSRQREQQAKMAVAMPGASQGTLPPLYFAPAVPELQKMQRRRSVAKMPMSSSYRSVAKVQDADKKEAQYPPSKPMHVKAAPSYLSSEAPVQNYRGLFNLAMIMLIVSNFRLIVDTIRLHGLALFQVKSYLERLSQHYAEDPWREFPFVSGFLLLQGFIAIGFVVEWLLSRNKLSETLGMTLHSVNSHATLLAPISIVWYHIDSPVVGACLLLNAAITWMKLISYSLANEDYRRAIKSGDVHAIEASLALLTNLEPEDTDISYPR
jgi:hypothetical protein